MRRLVALPLVAAAMAAALLASGAGGGPSTYRVDAVFDNASSLVPGNVVKIAGAPVGEVKDIRLTARRRARVEMKIEEGFAPFRADARCLIAPESIFIGEKFVQCRPGTPKARPLAGRDGRPPTVPLDRNSATVDLDLVLSTLRMPVRQRLSVLFSELGAGLAGRPRELSAAVRRANPALEQTNRVLRVLDEDRATLGRLVGHTDEVLAELAGRSERVQSFIDHAGEVTTATASRQDELQETIRRLPPLLDELEPSAERLGALAREATPALRSLRGAAPAVTTLLRDVRPLSRAGRPALRALGSTARVGRRAIRPARPVARRLRAAARRMPRVTRILSALGASLRSSGAIEGLQTFIYYTALSTSRFDRISHIVPAYVVFSECIAYARAPNPRCSAHFGGAPAGAAGSAAGRRQRSSSGAPRPRSEPAPGGRAERPATGPGRQAPSRPAPAAPRAPSLPLPQAPDPGESGIPLLDYLLGR